VTSIVAVGTFPPALQEDLDNARKWRTAYSFYSQRLTLRGQCLGISVVVLSAVTGTAIFASIGESPTTWAKVTVGAASVLAHGRARRPEPHACAVPDHALE